MRTTASACDHVGMGLACCRGGACLLPRQSLLAFCHPAFDPRNFDARSAGRGNQYRHSARLTSTAPGQSSLARGRAQPCSSGPSVTGPSRIIQPERGQPRYGRYKRCSGFAGGAPQSSIATILRRSSALRKTTGLSMPNHSRISSVSALAKSSGAIGGAHIRFPL